VETTEVVDVAKLPPCVFEGIASWVLSLPQEGVAAPLEAARTALLDGKSLQAFVHAFAETHADSLEARATAARVLFRVSPGACCVPLSLGLLSLMEDVNRCCHGSGGNALSTRCT
jgi:hypothetical protein